MQATYDAGEGTASWFLDPLLPADYVSVDPCSSLLLKNVTTVQEAVTILDTWMIQQYEMPNRGWVECFDETAMHWARFIEPSGASSSWRFWFDATIAQGIFAAGRPLRYTSFGILFWKYVIARPTTTIGER